MGSLVGHATRLLLIGLVLAAAGAPRAAAETLSERRAVRLLAERAPVPLPAGSQAAPRAVARIRFWVGPKAEVEAIELSCGERELFDEIAGALLEWKFRRKNFIAEITFVRRGPRAVLALDLPRAKRPAVPVCQE